MTTLKRHGGWKSSTVAEGYVEDSINNKINLSNKILDCDLLNVDPVQSSSKANNNNVTSTFRAADSSGINITSCSGCTINVNIVNNN